MGYTRQVYLLKRITNAPSIGKDSHSKKKNINGECSHPLSISEIDMSQESGALSSESADVDWEKALAEKIGRNEKYCAFRNVFWVKLKRLEILSC